MILEYSYDKANKILEYFKESKLASLTITKTEPTETKESTFVMEYSFITDYPIPQQAVIRQVLRESLPERLQLAEILNQFLENQILNNVNDFSLQFNAVSVRKCEINYSYSFKKNQDASLVGELVRCLERYDQIITKMGISDQETKNIFRREGSGRSKKYTLLTMKDVADTLRESLMEE